MQRSFGEVGGEDYIFRLPGMDFDQSHLRPDGHRRTACLPKNRLCQLHRIDWQDFRTVPGGDSQREAQARSEVAEKSVVNKDVGFSEPRV